MTQIDYGLDITRVTLAVNDLEQVTDYYQTTIGLNVLEKSLEHAVLGATDIPLLELQRDTHAKWEPNAPGLYHTAFLLPQRSDLASWLAMASDQNVKADGAADHIMSEAVYLSDPEGNGIEIYVDRPREVWAMPDGSIKGGSHPIDFNDLMPHATDWNGMPQGAKVGHVHLQVGDLAEAEAVFVDQLGMDVMTQMPGMGFYAVGGYHHQFGANTHQSRGMRKPALPVTGLRQVDFNIASKDALPKTIDAPWGTRFSVGEREAALG